MYRNCNFFCQQKKSLLQLHLTYFIAIFSLAVKKHSKLFGMTRIDRVLFKHNVLQLICCTLAKSNLVKNDFQSICALSTSFD